MARQRALWIVVFALSAAVAGGMKNRMENTTESIAKRSRVPITK
jgi:hypothetical protein